MTRAHHDRMANAIRVAFEMDAAERRRRMARMRAQVRERNIYRWAADLISSLAQIRLEKENEKGRSHGPERPQEK